MKPYNFDDVVKFLKDKGLYGMQVFNTRNWVGDPMKTIYNKDNVQIDFCSSYLYLEVFGLTSEDFNVLHEAFLDSTSETLKRYLNSYNFLNK